MAQMLIHDPTPLAWIIVAAYFVGAIVCFLAGRLAVQKRDRMFWLGTGLFLVLLGLNKQLDLQSLLTEAGRSIAQREGVYDARRLIQAVFILALATGSILGVATLSGWLRRSAASVKAATVGIVLLISFILIRAASFHHMDGWVTQRVAGIRSGWWLELAGIAVIGLSAMRYRGQHASNMAGTLERTADYSAGTNDGAQG
ncbi:hypothetical protein LZ016_14990 [Sphingomonas sp. SM33]|uniref:Isopropylmalate isomerase n=1 Tax=Sphingomonas telluris TaxID=2907998 RepID=A0ABS9VRX4_9SPHN|nr:hypothetical protein [Sphingomonas telluris]MCH8617402.1 hypothetical protein [Sphingomonas telluris]